MTAPDTLPPELEELGRLLHEDPPRPSPGWAHDLDARAAAGFPRPPRRRSRLRLRPLMPVLGVATSVLLVVVVVGLAGSQGDMEDSGGSGGGASSSAGSEAAPSSSGGEGTEPAPPAEREGPLPAMGDHDQSGPDDFAGGGSSLTLPTPVPPVPGGGDPRSDSKTARKVERAATLTLAARRRELDRVADGVVRVTDAAGGFVASSTVSSGDGGTFDLRVPTTRLQRTLADLSRLAHVRERSQSSRDITAQSVSARERLEDARGERRALLRQLERSDSLDEAARLRARLRAVSRQIASAKASVRRVDNRAAYANVTVGLVVDRSSGAAAGDGSWTPGDALRDAVRVLEVAAGVALIAVAVALPLALLALFGGLAARIAGRRRRERALDMA